MCGGNCRRNDRIPSVPTQYLWTQVGRVRFNPIWHAFGSLGAIAALVVIAAGRCDADKLIRARDRPITVKVVVDTAYEGDNLVPRNGHVNCTICLVAPLPPAGTVEPVTIADVDDGHRLSFSQTSVNLPANGNAMNFTIAGVHGSRNVGDALLQVRRGGEKLDANRRVTVYWFSNTSMDLASLNNYEMQYPVGLAQYCTPLDTYAVSMTAHATLNPLAVHGARIAGLQLAVVQNILVGRTACVYRSVSFVGWGPGVDSKYALPVPAECLRFFHGAWTATRTPTRKPTGVLRLWLAGRISGPSTTR